MEGLVDNGYNVLKLNPVLSYFKESEYSKCAKDYKAYTELVLFQSNVDQTDADEEEIKNIESVLKIVSYA